MQNADKTDMNEWKRELKAAVLRLGFRVQGQGNGKEHGNCYTAGKLFRGSQTLNPTGLRDA